MPGVTSVLYAAKRAAEAFGLDDEGTHWGLVRLEGGHQEPPELIPEGDVIAEHADVFMGLVLLIAS